LAVLDRLQIGQQLRVLAQAREPRVDVFGIDREAVALRALRQRLRLKVVVLLELEVLHHRARLPLHAALHVALIEDAPRADHLRALQDARLVEEHHVEALRLQRLAELAHEIDLVVEELVRLHLVEQQERDIEILVRPRDAPPRRGALRVGRVDRASLEERIELAVFLEKAHLCTYLYTGAGPASATAFATLARTRSPSVPPRSASTQRSGCGMSPRTLPASFRIP